MATVYRKKKKGGGFASPYWFARYKLANGKYGWKKTGLTKKREAKHLANEWEVEQSKLSKGQSKRGEEVQEYLERFVAEQNRKGWNAEDGIKAVVKLHEIATGKDLKLPTLKRHFLDWMIRKKEMVSESTYKTYGHAIKSFDRTSVGILDKRLVELEPVDLYELQRGLLREREETKITKKTINYKMSVIKGAIKDAYVDGLISRNIGLGVKELPEDDSTLKVPFTRPEIQTLIQSAEGNWKGMILFGANTGWRISVLANLRWEDIDPETRIVVDQNNKQMRAKKLKNRKPMVAYLKDSTWNYLKFIGLKKKGYIFPDIQAMNRDMRSDYFAEKLMVKAGVPKAVPHQYLKDKKGKPIMGERTFHCLRHSAISDMANNDVSMDVRKKSVGQSTDRVNEMYTHIDHETIKRNFEKVPDIEWQAVQ